jgi:hypothetical protein
MKHTPRFGDASLGGRAEEHKILNELFLQDISGYAPTGYKAAEEKLTLPVFEQKFGIGLLEDYPHRVR